MAINVLTVELHRVRKATESMKAMVGSLWLLAVLGYAVRAELEASPLGSPESCSAEEIKRRCGTFLDSID